MICSIFSTRVFVYQCRKELPTIFKFHIPVLFFSLCPDDTLVLFRSIYFHQSIYSSKQTKSFFPRKAFVIYEATTKKPFQVNLHHKITVSTATLLLHSIKKSSLLLCRYHQVLEENIIIILIIIFSCVQTTDQYYLHGHVPKMMISLKNTYMYQYYNYTKVPADFLHYIRCRFFFANLDSPAENIFWRKKLHRVRRCYFAAYLRKKLTCYYQVKSHE